MWIDIYSVGVTLLQWLRLLFTTAPFSFHYYHCFSNTWAVCGVKLIKHRGSEITLNKLTKIHYVILSVKKKCYSHFKESEIEREARRGKCHRLRFSVVSTQLTSICQHKKKCRHEIFPNCFQPFVVVTLRAVLAHLHLLLMCSFVGPNFLLLEIRIRPISIYILYLIQI